MAWSVKKRETYRWTVEHMVSMKNGAPFEVMKIDFEFKIVPVKEIEDQANKVRADLMDPWDFFGNVLAGWHDAPDGWEFSIDKLKELCLLYPGFEGSLTRSLRNSLLGGSAAR